MNNEIKHYGVLGMKWGRRKARGVVSTSKRTPKNKKEQTSKTKKDRASRNRKAMKVGASVVAGLLSSNFGAVGVFSLTGSYTATKVLAPTLGVIGGMKYYEWVNS